MVLAEIDVASDRDASTTIGFHQLARYAFGQNENKQKIPLSGPVTQKKPARSQRGRTARHLSQQENEHWTVSLVMPAELTLEDLPTPANEQIRLRQLPAQKQLAVCFSGKVSDKSLKRYTQLARDFAAQHKLELSKRPVVAFHDNPYTFPWKRHNELLFTVKESA